MDTITALWTGALLSAFGALVAYGLGSFGAALKAQRECRGHWLALRADIIRCGTLAAGYLAASVQVPTTRLPLRSYSVNFPALLMAGLLGDSEIEALARFFDNADSFNRSLDYAQEALVAELESYKREVSRAQLKAGKLATAQAQQAEALSIVSNHLEAKTGHWMLWRMDRRT